MIKILNISHRLLVPKFRSILKTHTNLSFFSTISDPYYILGVQKKADFKQIKKVFFKLANEYHPDKNQTAEAAQKFLLVKQAFESIKIQRGLMKPVNFVDSTSYESSRSNANQFNTDQEQFMKNNRDYRVFRQKAQNNAEYSSFNTSFKTIHDINDIKIKVEQGQMKDHSDRFHMEDFKTIIKLMPQSSIAYIVIGAAGIFLIYLMFDTIFTQVDTTTKTKQIVSKSEQHQRRSVSNKSVRLQHQKQQFQRMKQSQQIQNYVKSTQQLQSKTSKEISQMILKKSQKKDFKTSNSF